MSRLLLTFYGDDFTGSTDALEQLTLAGIRTALFIRPPTPAQLRKYPGIQAVSVAGKTRSLAPAALERELKPALLALKRLGTRHVHYKVCSTFDSSPTVGSIGRVMELGARIFTAPFIPLLVAAPALGRYTVFGQHFARYGIGSTGEIHRLDRHPAISHHPVTPMQEADLRLHLARQTRQSVALFDILQVALPFKEARSALQSVLADQPDAVLFDALTPEHLVRIGQLLERFANANRPLFSVGSSGIETALASAWAGGSKPASTRRVAASAVKSILVGSGSCSPVTSGQIIWALERGFAEVPLTVTKLATAGTNSREIRRAIDDATRHLQAGRSVIVHTTRTGSAQRTAGKFKGRTAAILGRALGEVLRGALEQTSVRRFCIAGGDTSSYAARVMEIEALEMIAPLTPGAPLCRVTAPGSPLDGCEGVFKGGQVGPPNYFELVKRGKV